MTNGRAKGARGELEVAAIVTDWWERLEPGCRFKRTPGSGGWATPDVRKEFGTAGDLVTTAKRFPWSVEVKWRQNWTWKELLAGRRSPVWSWWGQALAQGEESGLEPMLWMRHTGEPWWMLLRGSYVQRYDELAGATCLEVPLRGLTSVALLRASTLLDTRPERHALRLDGVR